MRILILSIYHDPEPIPKTGELARELQARGHSVTVVTAFPHYPSGDLYPGYRLAPWRREVLNGVPVLRTFIYPYHGRSAMLRMANYLTWMLSSMMAAWLTPRCDVMYVWHPPLTVGVSAWVIGKLKRVPFVYDVQDLWPESALASGLMKPGRLVSALERLAGWVYARAPRILVVSDRAADHLRQRGVDPRKIVVAPHWFDDAAFRVPSNRDVRAELDLSSRFAIMFAGNLGMVQGLDTVIDAAERLKTSTDIVFVLVGDGADRARLEAEVAKRRLTNVVFAGRHAASAMPDFLRASDALLVHIRPSDVAEHAIPTKILAYFAAGRPILCAMGGAAGDLVTDADAGVVIEPGDAARLAAAVASLAALPLRERERFGSNGRRFLAEHFERQHVIDFYEAVLADVVRVSSDEAAAAAHVAR
jgi:glycosyltransferase involved in cell wall biosynthesis